MKFSEEDIMWAWVQRPANVMETLLSWIEAGGTQAYLAVAILINPDILSGGIRKDTITQTVQEECQTVSSELDKTQREIIYKMSKLAEGNSFKNPNIPRSFRKFST